MSAGVFHPSSKGYHAAISVVRVLVEQNHIAYLAGGCVRDLLLGVDPKDFDVATDATPDQIASYFQKTASVGAAFGVMLVRDYKETIEVATFRSDGVYSDARRPDSVEFSTPQADAQRRDFTVNALFIDPLVGDESHQIIDLVNGIPDVNARVLRAVGDPEARLREDHLRALRAVRFAAKYQLTIDPVTFNAIRSHASALSGVSIERIGEEMRRMMLHPSRAKACQMLHELELDSAIFGETQSFDSSLIDSLDESADYALSLVALALGRGHQIDDGHAALCSHYRKMLDLSNADRDSMRSIFDCLVGFSESWKNGTEASKKRLASREKSAGALQILAGIDPNRAESIQSEIDHLSTRFGGLSPTPLMNGAMLVELGLTPGPRFKEILDAAYDLQLAGEIESQPEAVRFVQNQVNNSD